jgi:MFS family permease
MRGTCLSSVASGCRSDCTSVFDPSGVSTLIYGPLADRIGIHRVMFASLAAFSILSMLTATAHTIEKLTLFRMATGIGASGVVPLALARVGRINPMSSVAGRLVGCSEP